MTETNKEHPYGYHAFDVECDKCKFIDAVIGKELKGWKCPHCKRQEEVAPTKNTKEVHKWRNLFLDEIFMNEFVDITDENKEQIRTLFLAIPSESFREPFIELITCVGLVFAHNE